MGAASFVSVRPYVYRSSFVGRDECLPVFDDAVRNAKAGQGSIFFVSGESGAGKTRLLTEVGTSARRGGLSVISSDVVALMATEQNELLNVRAAALAPQSS